MKHEPSILEQFKEREDEIRRETAALDKEMSKKREVQEKLQADASLKLMDARTTLARMKANYLRAEGECRDKAAVTLRGREVTADKVKAGEVSMSDFIETGLSETELMAEAQAMADEKLAEAMKLIREKGVEVCRLELEEAEARREIIFCATYPGQSQIERLKYEIQTLEQGVSAVLNGYPQAMADVDAAKINIELCRGKSLSGLNWDSLGLDEIRDLRFDARIGAEYMHDLESFIAKADPEKKYNVWFRLTGFGAEGGLTFSESVDSKKVKRITTSEMEMAK